jgi:3-oxoacyl-[acyl-carrier-protein] synthase-3
MVASSPWMLLEGDGHERAPAAHRARFESIGRCLPEHRVTTDELMASTAHNTRIDLERLTGVRERRMAQEGEDSLTLALGAARDCLERSRYEPADLDVILNCSITRDTDGLHQQFEPPLSLEIKRALGADRALNLDVSNACAGMLTGVFLLNDMIRLGDIERGLVVSGEYISHLARNAAQDVRNILSRQLASLTLGDAGAAVLVERAPDGVEGISLAGFTTIAEHSRLCLAYPSKSAPGASMFTKAQALQRAAIADTGPLLAEILAETGLDFDEIDYLIPHQTSVRAIKKGVAGLRERFGGAPRETVITVDQFGNTASTTHFVALAHLLSSRSLKPDDRVMLVALASGIEIGFVIFTPGDLVDQYWEGPDHGNDH